MVGPSGSFPSVLFLIQRRWMVDSDGAGPDDDEYDKLDYIPSVSVHQPWPTDPPLLIDHRPSTYL